MDINNNYCGNSKLPIRIVIVWLTVLAVCYNVFQDNSPDHDAPIYIPHTHLVDAVVFIAMGAIASDPMVDYSIASVRELGKWKGDIYVVTDSRDCFREMVRDYEVKILDVPEMSSLLEIKSLKPKLMTLLPNQVLGALYIDVDILVTRNLAAFFKDLGSMIYFKQEQINRTRVPAIIPSETIEIKPDFDFGAFPDAKGHFVGFCHGCEKWHSGILWLRRGLGEHCLAKWSELILSGSYGSDQEALDAAEKVGSCPNSYSLPTRHLLFGKDYIAMVLTSGQTFIHLTAAGRPETQDYLYREVVVPRIRNSLHPPLDPRKLVGRKQCSRDPQSSNNR